MRAFVCCVLLACIVTQISCDDEGKKSETKAVEGEVVNPDVTHQQNTGHRCGGPYRCGRHHGCATRAFVRCPYTGHRHIRVHAPGPHKPQVHYERGEHPQHLDVRCPRPGPNHIIVQPPRPQKPLVTFHGHGSYDKSYYFSPHGDGHHHQHHHDSGCHHQHHDSGCHQQSSGHCHHHSSGCRHHSFSCSCSSDSSHHFVSSSSESCSDSESKQKSIHIHFDHKTGKHKIYTPQENHENTGKHETHDGNHKAIAAWKLLEKKQDEVKEQNTEVKGLKVDIKNDKKENSKKETKIKKPKHESNHESAAKSEKNSKDKSKQKSSEDISISNKSTE